MSRYLALDIGEKRIGVALSDPSRLIAQPLKTIHFKTFEKFVAELKEILAEYQVEKIIVGLPLTLRGTHSRQTEKVLDMISRLEKALSLPIIQYDERLTTFQAEQTLRALGKKPSKERHRIDQLAAMHLLQTYLDEEKRGEHE